MSRNLKVICGVFTANGLGQPHIEIVDACMMSHREIEHRIGKVEPDFQTVYCAGGTLAWEDVTRFVLVEFETADTVPEKYTDCFVVDSFGHL